jgi:sec-independent protein translocase protein TatA
VVSELLIPEGSAMPAGPGATGVKRVTELHNQATPSRKFDVLSRQMGLDNPLHIAFLLVVALLIFGAKRLPEMGRSLGTGMREFKQSVTGELVQAPPEPAKQAQAEQRADA